jgi:peptidyl-prolyl cis-trans isomerase C
MVSGAIALALTQQVFAEEPTAATVVATVNGAEITLGNLIVARAALPAEYQSLPDDLIFGGLLDQVIQQVVIEQSMEGKLSLLDELTLLNDRRAYLSSVLVDQVSAAAVTDAAVQAAYDAKFAEFKPQTEYNAAHILVDTQEQAADLLKQIEAGAEFAAVAAEHSNDGSAQAGGDLGWFGMDMMVEPFETAVVAAEVGKPVGPVQTEFGYHLILVKETRNSAKPELAAVRPEIEAGLMRDAVLAQVDAMVAGAKVEKPGEGLDPTLLKNTDLLK